MERQVEQIHACLADAIRRNRARPFETPVTVAEIYQDLVPYRSVRARIGFEMNADYEHTLLRLLAGEGELVRLEPREARDELKAELASANPNVGLFRKFAACDVWIVAPSNDVILPAVPPAAPRPAGEDALDAAFDAWESRSNLWRNAGEPPALDDMAELELLLEEEDVEPETAPPVPEPVKSAAPVQEPLKTAAPAPAPLKTAAPAPAPLKTAPPVPEPAKTAAASPQRKPKPEESRVPIATKPTEERAHHHSAEHGQCAFCDANLPKGRNIRYCPFCGADQSMIPCAACGEALEQTWVYCIACGAAAPPQVPH